MGGGAAGPVQPGSTWTPDALFTAQTIRIASGPELGLIRARFSLDALESEISAFREGLVASQQTYQREATIWVIVTDRCSMCSVSFRKTMYPPSTRMRARATRKPETAGAKVPFRK